MQPLSKSNKKAGLRYPDNNQSSLDFPSLVALSNMVSILCKVTNLLVGQIRLLSGTWSLQL